MKHVWYVALGLLLFAGIASSVTGAEPVASVDFGRDVLPLLRRSCVECHGPAKREGGLRLDSRAATLQGGDSGAALLPSQPDASELLRRVALAKDDPEVMPARGEPLSAAQVKLLRDWIAAGASWPDNVQPARHWAYIKPQRPELPAVQRSDWVSNPLDRFVLAKLERAGLSPSPEADPATLVRRLYLDLIGIPPTPDQVVAFEQSAIRNPQSAIASLVDSLLASDQFGVRWARPWLDYARYADSHGFQRDDLRDIWPYRDWVVSALNADMPFDQFTIEQLAGDLLPNATESQRIATGFNRNAPTNVEAGSDPEETRVNQVFDRVNTLGMIWLGTSLECAQCHDHKYDPFTMREYYGLFAFLNQTEIEADRSNPKTPGSIRFLGPQLTLDDPTTAAQQQALQQRLKRVQRELAARENDARATLAEWAESLQRDGATSADETPREIVLPITDFDSLGGATHEVLDDQSVLLSGEAPDRDTYTITVKTALRGVRAIRLDALTHDSLPGDGPGRGDKSRPNFVLNRFALDVQSSPSAKPVPIRFNKARADFSQAKFDVSGAIDDDPRSAWAINPEFHEPHWAEFTLAEPLECTSATTLTFTLEQNFGGARTIGRLRLTALTGRAEVPSLPAEVAAALAVSADKRTTKQTTTLMGYRLRDDRQHALLVKERTRIEAELKQVQPPSTLVMRAVDEPRTSTLFMRGDFRTPGESIAPHTPAVLHPFPVGHASRVPQASTAPSDSQPATDSPAAKVEQTPNVDQAAKSAPIADSRHAGRVPNEQPTRLDLARWLVDRDNPLVARVTVNRWWAELFGHGIVTTPEDFGIKGEPPTHPELLDWLAVEFIEHDWSLKHVLRTIVLSSTYRQSSKITPELLRVDDQNLLYTRGPRFRLEAELIRDNALAIADALNTQLGGPPIRPHQPDGLWVKVGGQRYDYVVSPGKEKFRRGLYVVWKRGAPYPSLVNFDANARLACRVKRPRSNTPLQALTLMNDPVYVEIAQQFALHVLNQKQLSSLDARLTYAFRRAVARAPQDKELAALRALFELQIEALDSAELKKFTQGVELPRNLNTAEFGAWYAVCAALLNLDETISRN